MSWQERVGLEWGNGVLGEWGDGEMERSAVTMRGLLLVAFLLSTSFAQPEIIDGKPPVSTYRIPAAMTLCGEKIPLELASVRERFDREFYYTLDREGQLVLYLKRAARCNPVIEPILKASGLPDDLKYLAVAESGLLFRAQSPASAVGYWQFIRGTAKRYGLRIDQYVDERRDLERSTRAAVAYLKELRERFGSWALALAAYNWGEERIDKAVRQQGSSNYYDLYMPDETDRFVLRIAVLKLLLDNPQGFDIYLPQSELYKPPRKEQATVSSKYWFSIDVLSSCANVAPRAFRFLNPWMISNTLPAGTYDFSVPIGVGSGYAACVTKKTAGRQETIHVVRRGESLTLIAERYGVTIGEIERWNNISRWKPIHPGQRLVILADG